MSLTPSPRLHNPTKPECCCCQDPATKKEAERLYCLDCWNELFQGVLDQTPAKLGVGRGE